MRIDNLDLEPPGSGRTTLATFDVALSPDVTLRRWALRRNDAGQLRTSPPAMRGGHRPVSLSAGLQDQLNSAAIAAYRTIGGPLAHDANSPQ